MKCRRCGNLFEQRRSSDERCLPCERDVAAILEADIRRRSKRFPFAKELVYG
jgi:hypothetical protein